MNDPFKKSIRFAVVLLLIILVISGCAKNNGENISGLQISIAEQYGLAYAPLQIMKENKILEKNLSGLNVEWQQLGNTAEIREAMLAGKVDAGFLAIPPFLIGWDKGMEWKIATGLSSSPVGLVTNQERIKSLKDFTEKDKIALPQPGSVQHILLAMAAEHELGDAHKLDNLLVTLSHPDGMNALLANKEIAAHFTALPYLAKELEDRNMRQILSGNEIIGANFSFIVGVATKKLHDENPQVYQTFVKSVQEAVDFINSNPQEAARILAPYYGLSPEEILKYISYGNTEYSTSVKGIDKFASFMVRQGYIAKPLNKVEEVGWEDVKYGQ